MITYLIFILTLAGIYSLLALGLVTSWGQGGMVNLGLVGLFGLGAYVSALLSKADVPIALDWLAATVLTAIVGAGLCFVVRNLKGDYLAIVTLGFAEVLRLVELNEKWLTGGSDGIAGIVAPLRQTFGAQYGTFYLILTWSIVLIACLVLTVLLRSPFGRALRAIRDDEQVAAVAGKPVLILKMQAFAIGAALSGLAGAIYAHFTSFIAPDVFVVALTVYIFLAVTVGGYSRLLGAVVGSLFVVTILEASRFLAGKIGWIDAVQAASLREFAIAAALIAVMQIRPVGLFGMKSQKSGYRPEQRPETVTA